MDEKGLHSISVINAKAAVAFQRQRMAFYFAFISFSWFAIWASVRSYFIFIDDTYGLRQFVLHPNSLLVIPVCGLSWIFAFIAVGNSIRESRQVYWYGIGALVMLAVLGIPVAIMVFKSFWRFYYSL